MTTTHQANESSSDQAELIAQLQAGDQDAYETMFRTHVGAMNAVARRFLGDTDDAADAVQEAFVSAFKAMKTFNGEARLGTWLHRITVNSCLMKLRGRKRQSAVSLDSRFDPADRMPSSDNITRDETINQVRKSIARLPYDYRTVIQLRDLDGLDTAEAAGRLGVSEVALKVRLHRARKALKVMLEPAFGR
jgi:RNA polymerase sigma-70 factor (ECF subfamily)